MLALATLALDDEEAAAALAKRMRHARTPPKWRKIHGRLDRAAQAMRHMN